jgi:hypothetical protein
MLISRFKLSFNGLLYVDRSISVSSATFLQIFSVFIVWGQ